MFRKVGLLALHPPQQFGYFHHCHFDLEDKLMMSGSGHSAVDSGVGTSASDNNTDTGSASSSPYRSACTQRLTPALKSLFYIAFVVTASWERDLRYRSRPRAITVNRGTDPMLLFLPSNTITASELEAAQSIGRDLRNIADEYAENEEVRRRTMELEGRRESFLKRLLCW